jgi:hypothetical protein
VAFLTGIELTLHDLTAYVSIMINEYCGFFHRHYYAANIMRRVDGRRLHYQFLENAKGWREMATYPEELEST